MVLESLRVGVIGLGVISRFYLAALDAVPGIHLAAACDTDAAALAPLRESVACYRDHRELLARADVDAVVVTVPNDLHAAVCRDALAADLAVCVEKPLATRLDEGRALDRIARDRGLVLFTALHRRYNRAVLRLVGGLPGRPPVRSLTVRYLERIEDHVGGDRWYLDPARCGGGCVADNGPNAYDLVRLLVGESEVVDATVERDRHGVDRRALVVLRARSGALARVELDWSYPGECKDIEVRFADGSRDRADLLGGYQGFKGSLWHEYEGIVADFAVAVSRGDPGDPAGLAALALVHATYQRDGDQGRRRLTGATR